MAFSYSGQKFVDHKTEYIKPVWDGGGEEDDDEYIESSF